MSQIVLHIPPKPSHLEGQETSLPCLDPASLATVFYLQLTRPGRFSLHAVEDLSSTPHGHIPYIISSHIHAEGSETAHAVPKVTSTFDSIFQHLGGHLDEGLTEDENAKSVAWKVCIQAKLGDLVTYVFYGNALNYNLFTHPYLVSGLSFWKRYYLPKRIRESFKRRLESEGMWEEGVHNREKEKSSMNKGIQEKKAEKVNETKRKIKQSFANEKIFGRARETFSLFQRLLEASEGSFMFGHSPTSSDLLLASHILVLLPTSSSLPEKQLGHILEKDFSRLVAHARTVEQFCISDNIPRTSPCQCVV